MELKRFLAYGQGWLYQMKGLSWVRMILSRLTNSAPASADYKAWRHRFFIDRLGLSLWLALIILSTFIARDLFSLFVPLRELEKIPDQLKYLWIPIDVSLSLLLTACLIFHRTAVGRRYPSVIFLGLSWSGTLVPQILANLHGSPLPDLLGWSLVFMLQATLIPVRWELHLISQLGLLIYFYGVNSVLGLTKLPVVSGGSQESIFALTVVMYVFWFCFICDLAVYLYERLQRAEFESRRQAQLFLHAVSHDLRNPVIGTSLLLKNLLKRGEETVAVPRSLLERMIDSSDRQLSLINSLLDVHNSDLQGRALQQEPIDLCSLADSTISDLEPLLEENQAVLTNQISQKLPLVYADTTQIWRVFSNLVANALHHNPPGIKLTIHALPDGEMVRCTVQDNGVGMTVAECNRAFDLYARGLQARSTVGLGLGLYICRQIIAAHGGNVGVTSSPGSGAAFWFTLPLASAVGKDASQSQPEGNSKGALGWE